VEYLNRESIDYRVAGHSLADVVNYEEIVVLQALRELLESDDTLCRCQLCVEDMYALTLNMLPASYIQVVSAYKYSASASPDVVRARLSEAAAKVKAQPKHG